MAASSANRATGILDGMARTPWLRQLLMMVGIAVSVAVGTAAILWSTEPEYRTLYGALPPERAAIVVESLSSVGIPYRLQQQTGAIMVPASQLHDARIRLAGAGVVNDGSGLEMLREEKGFGVSDFMQSKKYEHALETELARTIESMHQVRKARVHLALPKETVFVRDRREPSASVMLDIFAGSSIDRQQVKAIVNMVSASVANLKAEAVTVVDQQGNLLSSQEENSAFDVNAKQFEYRKKIEREYEQRITGLLTPITGAGRVRVQAAVELDFSHVEESRESWNPESRVVRSEQVNIDRQGDKRAAAGVPGALANQPPAADANANADEGEANAESSSITRNYEIERVLNYTARPAGDIRRLSIAVVLDTPKPESGSEQPYSAEQIDQLTTLVRDAVGFNADRGDRVTVISASFLPVADEPAVVADVPLWQQEWFMSLIKQVLTGIAMILIVVGVIRPTIKSLINSASAPAGGETVDPSGDDLSPAVAALGPPGRGGANFEDSVSAVRSTADQDPRRVAQVLKKWVADDAR